MKPEEQDGARFAYEGLDRLIHERARLSVLTSLATYPGGLGFVELKRLCNLTDGNLARHLQVLEAEGMVKSTKEDDERRTKTLCRITPEGRARYMAYLTSLEQVIRDAAAVTRQAEMRQDESPLKIKTVSPLRT